jgi:hypothetical protein
MRYNTLPLLQINSGLVLKHLPASVKKRMKRGEERSGIDEPMIDCRHKGKS